MASICLNAPFGARRFLTVRQLSGTMLSLIPCLNAPFGAQRFLTARRVAPPVTRGNAMSDRQWSKKHPSDQQARDQNIRLFVATTRIATDRPQDEFRSGNRFPHRRVARPQHSTPRPLFAPDVDSSQRTPTPPERIPPRRQAPPTSNFASLLRATGRRHA